MELDRMAQLFTAPIMALAAIIILGPGAPSILAQHAANQLLVRLRRNR
jgi:hypothetical protein